MHVQRRFSFPKLGKKCDGSLEMLGACTGVILKIFKVGYAGLLGDCLGLLLVFCELSVCMR